MAGRLKWPVSIIFLLFSFCAKPQKVFFEHLTTAEGLPSDYVNTVFKDSKGFLWVGTDKGACRYDGKQFLYFTKDNGLPSNFVYCFAEDSAGRIWIGTMEGGLCRYDGQTVSHFGYQKSDFKNIRQIYFNTDNSFFLLTFDTLYYFKSEEALPEKVFDLRSLFPIGDGLFLSGKNDSIYTLKKKSHNLSIALLPRQDFYSIAGDQLLSKKGDTVSAFTTDGTRFIHQRDFILRKNNFHPKSFEVKSHLISGNELFIATVKGLVYTKDETEMLLTSSNGLGVDYIRNIYKDDRGNIYICTFGAGIKIWPGLYLQEFNTMGKVTSIFPDGNQVYFTTSKNVYRYRPDQGLLPILPDPGEGNFTSIYKSPSGRYYLGTLNRVYSFPDERRLQVLDRKFEFGDRYMSNAGISGFLTTQEHLFVSTYGNGIQRFDRSSDLRSGIVIDSGIVESLTPLKNSFAALTYSYGLSVFKDRGSPIRITTNEKLLSNTVYSTFQENDSELWIGTSQGLNLYDGREVINSFSKDDGLIGSKVICIFRDRQKRFWVLSDRYLHLLENNKLTAIRSHPVLYDIRNSINRAAYDQRNDVLWIGLTEALRKVDMHKIITDESFQPLKLIAVLVDTAKMLDPSTSLSFSRPPGNISFVFSQGIYSLARKNDFFYKLSGFDEEWKLLDNSEVNYQRLPAGNYELITKSTGPDGFTSPENSLVTIEVLPTWWKRAWFIIAISVLFLAGFFFIGQTISKKRYHQKLLRMHEAYRLQMERERIARELHDNVGSQLTYLINKIDDDYPLLAHKNEADKLGNFARGAMQNLRETIWALDKKEIKSYDLEDKVIQLAQLYPAKNIKTEFNWNDHRQGSLSLKALHALNIYRMIQESLNNALKHSKAEEIRINLTLTDKMLRVQIADNGIGFNTDVPSQRYGLRNLKSRAAEINARLVIKSLVNEGTVISIDVPLNG